MIFKRMNSPLQEHNVGFVPEPAGNQLKDQKMTAVSQTVAALAPEACTAWQSDFTVIAWTVTWSVTGLTPVRPIVAVIREIVVPKESCFPFGMAV